VKLNVAPALPDSLLTQARAGDADAFAALVRAHQGSVFSIGLRMLNRRDAAEDLAQDVFLQLYRRLGDIESLEHLGYWLRRVAANLAIDWLRRLPYAGTQPLDEGTQVAAQEASQDPLMDRQLHRLLGELSPHARAVMLLRYQEDHDLADIGVMLDMPVNTVKSHIKRSLTTLRSRLVGAKLVDCEPSENSRIGP
jgi:RNA polymerase sigma-70 factor (ECF subfamily)